MFLWQITLLNLKASVVLLFLINNSKEKWLPLNVENLENNNRNLESKITKKSLSHSQYINCYLFYEFVYVNSFENIFKPV